MRPLGAGEARAVFSVWKAQNRRQQGGIINDIPEEIIDAIRQMMQPEEKGRKSIGFKVEEEGAAYL
jgi:hypothetical protein